MRAGVRECVGTGPPCARYFPGHGNSPGSRKRQAWVGGRAASTIQNWIYVEGRGIRFSSREAGEPLQLPVGTSLVSTGREEDPAF